MTVRIMPLGDSITALTGENNYRLALFDLLAATGINFRFVGPNSYGTAALPDKVNNGVSGQRLDTMETLIAAQLATYQPDVILLIGGTNDIFQGATGATTASRLTTLLTTIYTAAPRAIVVTGPPPLMTHDLTDWTAYRDAIPGIVTTRQGAGQLVRLIDTSGVAVADTIGHPSPAGYSTLGGLFFAALPDVAPASTIADTIPRYGFGSIDGTFGSVTAPFGVLFGDDPSVGSVTFEWIDPSGVLHPLSDNAVANLLAGVRGLGMVGGELADDRLPTSAGSVMRRTRTPPRVIEGTVLLEAASAYALEELLDEVCAWFATADELTGTPGIFRVTRRDYTKRQVTCFQRGDGLNGHLGDERDVETWTEIDLELYAPDPYPVDANPLGETYDQDDLGESLTVENPGQLDAWPIWRVSGPGSAITVTNTSTNESFALTANGGLTLALGDSVTIDTRPTSARTDLPILDGDGTSQFSKLNVPTGKLWHLPPGTSTIEIEVTGADANTRIELSYRARYRGLLR